MSVAFNTLESLVDRQAVAFKAQVLESASKGSKRPIQLLRLSAAHPAHTDVPFFASSA